MTNTNSPWDHLSHTMTVNVTVPNRFYTYRISIIPKLRERGYHHFLACPTVQFYDHEEWAFANCKQPSIANCDTWAVQDYPRAFMSAEDAALFRLRFDCAELEQGGEVK